MNQDTFLSRWSQFFIQKYKTTILLILAIGIAGFFGAFNNQRQDFPAIPSNFIGVNVTYIGASSADIERDVIIPIEQAVSEVDGVKKVTANAADNFGSVTLEMNDVEGTENAADEIEKLVSRVGLPADAEPTVSIYDAIGPSAVYTLTSDTASKKEILEYVDTVRQELLNSSTEIKDIEAIPDNEFQVSITYDVEALNDKGLTGAAYNSALESQLTALPGGFLEKDSGESLAITVETASQTIEDIQAIEVNGVPLRDVATVVREPKDIEKLSLAGFLDESVQERTVISRDGVYLFVYKKDDGDVIRIADALEKASDEVNAGDILPDHIRLAEVYDNSGYVEGQISALISNGVAGLILILVVLMLFINLRTGIVVAGIIPLAFLGTLAILYAIGFSINILTLFGLLLVLGILVDNAIVIAEGVVHNIENGMDKDEAVKETIRELGAAVTAATLTTVVVFIPFASIGGIIGAFLKYIPYTIIIMLLVSYFLAVTITPVLAKYILKQETKKERQSHGVPTWQKVLILPWIIVGAQALIDKTEHLYSQFNAWIHKRFITKLLTVVVALGLIVVSFGAFASKIAVEQFPSNDSNILLVSFDVPAETAFEVRNDAVRRIMEKAVQADYLQSYFYMEGSIQMIFDEPDDRPDGNEITVLQEQVQSLVAQEAADIFTNTGIEVKIETAGVGPPESTYDVVIEIRGDNIEDLKSAAASVETFLVEREDVTEVVNGYTDKLVRGVDVAFKQDELRNTGIDPVQANFAVRSIFAEQTIGSITLRSDGISDEVVTGYNTAARNENTDLSELVVGVNTSVLPPQQVRLQDIATVEEVEQLQTISRMDGKRVVAIQAVAADGADVAAIEAAVRDHINNTIEEYNLDPEEVVYGGFAASNNENYSNLILVFILAIIAVYLILVYQFNSFIQPGLILFTIPLALIGVFPGLYWVNSSINMVSGLGIVALVGIVVNDAIVFMDYYNRLRAKHYDKSLAELVVMTGRARFKPILSTSITTIFGVLPLTVNDPFWQGLGISLIGGLICSTIGTLLVFPILVSWTDHILSWLKQHAQRLMKRSNTN